MSELEKPVLTLHDLENWETFSQDQSSPARLAVIGDPVAHSRSPQMHNPALEADGRPVRYVRLHLTPDELSQGIALMKKNGFIGFNVTIPHKDAVFHAVDDLTEVARRVGAVNTVAIDGDQLIGHNTDAPGLKAAIREEFSMDLEDLRIMVIGAGGGAGRAASVQCAMEKCDRLVLVNRTVEKAQSLALELAPLFRSQDRLQGPADRLVAIPWNEREIEREISQVDLIINATSVGMKRTDSPVLPPRLIEPSHLVYDMIYAPPRTRLLADAAGAGARGANGLGMLLWQGALAYEFWFNAEAPIDAMRQGLIHSL